MIDTGRIIDASRRLDTWIESQGFCGWDPFDALNSSLAKSLSFGNRRIGQAWVQLLKGSFVNLRPLISVPKGYNPKGMGLFLSSYLQKYQRRGAKSDIEKVIFFADWLQKNISSGYHGACWGYNFDWPNRGFYAPKGTPTIVNTAFIGLAFLDFYRLAKENSFVLGQQFSSPESLLEIARSSCQFILHDLHVLRSGNDECCFSYTPLDTRCVHNANLLGSWLLAEVGAITSEPELIQAALQSARYSARRQRGDGSWPYGEAVHDAWVDSFHTGYVLVALKHIGECLNTSEFQTILESGYQFWKRTMFLLDGTPKFYANSTYPVDTHCAAQAIITFLAFEDQDSQAREGAGQVAGWAVKNLQNAQGFFNYQRTRFYINRIPYMRWTQAWMQRALTEWEGKCDG